MARINHAEMRALAEMEIQRCDECKGDALQTYPGWMPVYELLDELGVPERLQRYTTRWLQCPYCEAGLSRYTWIEREGDEGREHRIFVAKSKARYRKPLRLFHRFLTNYPTLGARHSIGKQLLKDAPRYPQTAINEQRWFRARRKPVDRDTLTSEDMWVPGPEVAVPQGRFNHEGQRALYLCDDLRTAAIEISASQGTLIEGEFFVQEYEIRNLTGILNIHGTGASMVFAALLHEQHLNTPVDRSGNWKPEYFVPRFVADIARSRGLNGIRYQTSHILWEALGMNLVVFSPQPENFIPLGPPKKYRLYRDPIQVMDFYVYGWGVAEVPPAHEQLRLPGLLME